MEDIRPYIGKEIGGPALMVRVSRQILAAMAATMLLAGPAWGQSTTAAAVSAAYDTYHIQPMWFRGGVQNPAVAQLISILQRSPFDGFPEGPQLAAQVQAAVAQAASGRPEDTAAAERILSTAWVSYVQALKQPTRGMIYAFPSLKAQGTSTSSILLTAAAAPSLDQYVVNTSRLNPIYDALRDAAWAEAQASGCPE